MGLMVGSDGELQDLNNSIIDRAKTYGMKVRTEESKIMTNSMNNISVDIDINDQKLEEVVSFKYLGTY